jgi:hypothetical protein
MGSLAHNGAVAHSWRRSSVRLATVNKRHNNYAGVFGLGQGRSLVV